MKNIISNLITSVNPASQISPCPGPQFSTASPLHDRAGVFLRVLKSFVMFFRTILLVLLMLLPACAGARVLAKDYMSIVNKTSKSSIKSVMRQADRYLEAGHQDTALVYYMVVCNRMDDKLSEEDKKRCAVAFMKKGNIYYMKGGFADALKAYFNGLRIIKMCKDQLKVGQFYNNIGSVYYAFNELDKAYAYYKNAYKYSSKYRDRQNENKILTNLTILNVQLGKTREARKCFYMSEKLKNKNDKESDFKGRFNYGLILIAEKNYAQAVSNFKSLLAYSHDDGMEPRFLCSVYEKLYKSYMELGERDSTLKYLKLCENTAVKHGIHYFYLDVLLDHADYFDAQGDYKSASRYRARYQKDRDSVYNIHDFERVKNEQTLYEMDKYDKYIASLNEREKERVQTISAQRYTLAAVSSVTLVVGLLLFVVYRQKQRIDKSYNNLFVVNRNFVNNQEIMRQRLQDALSRLKDSEAESERLKVKLASYDVDAVAKEADASDLSDGVEHKAKSGAINDDMRRKLLDSVVDIMENTTEFCSADFSLARMASLVGSNSKYVSLIINDTFHKSFKNYVNEYRIHLACLRMSDTDGYGSYTLNAIAESVGFKSYTTFVELFRKIVGITPSLYKDKLKACGDVQA